MMFQIKIESNLDEIGMNPIKEKHGRYEQDSESNQILT